MKKRSTRFTLLFIFSVLLTLVATVLIELAVGIILFYSGVFYNLYENATFYVVLLFLGASIIIGSFLSIIFSTFILTPMHSLTDGIDKLADGEFSTRIDLGSNAVTKQVSISFNTLAEELQKTEILRSNFINDFSHEFKTPISSIQGFAKLLLDESVPQEKRAEYLRIIEQEADRLAVMSTNVLNLNKLEHQTSVSNKTSFNLSEQLRTSILLLEKKWEEKNLSFDLNFDEIFFVGDCELFKHVWINLIDNAVKFANDNTTITVNANVDKNFLVVSISNFGQGVLEEDKNRLFDKFYQCDKSRHVKGNGIGLSVVKRVISLHDGEIFIASLSNPFTITIKLPVN